MNGIVPSGMCPAAYDADCPYRRNPTIKFCEFHERHEICPFEKMMQNNELIAMRMGRRMRR